MLLGRVLDPVEGCVLGWEEEEEPEVVASGGVSTARSPTVSLSGAGRLQAVRITNAAKRVVFTIVLRGAAA
ncbi:MAG: hypothetical protein AAF533_18410 [Acidobacteriota bacterium]